METCGDCRYLDGTDCRRFPATAKKLPEVPACGEYRAKEETIEPCIGINSAPEAFESVDPPPGLCLAKNVIALERWRPYESHPEPGADALIYTKCGRTLVARWSGNETGGWCIPGIGGFVATHWMPLPAPPTSEGG